MKEYHIFYAPDLPEDTQLPPDEAIHAVRVLRLREGDDICATDGRGNLYDCILTEATQKRCRMEVKATRKQERIWQGHIQVAVAPTKNIDRIEWLAEKATEIGMDTLTLLECTNSERRVVKTERIEKILVSAMKQSHKAYKPALEGMTKFDDFIRTPFQGQRFICHCYSDEDAGMPAVPLLTALNPEGAAQVLIGPEGDFSIDEVRRAISLGFQPATLGESRLRTETAALCAVHMMYLRKTHIP